ncbi:eukaryotic translation initiation factor 4B3 [Trifolium repens]|nr:eukaryotic translation initiation factor 4B3 [Trifolium repens]
MLLSPLNKLKMDSKISSGRIEHVSSAAASAAATFSVLSLAILNSPLNLRPSLGTKVLSDSSAWNWVSKKPSLSTLSLLSEPFPKEGFLPAAQLSPP